jgi:hypothetical protein
VKLDDGTAGGAQGDGTVQAALPEQGDGAVGTVVTPQGDGAVGTVVTAQDAGTGGGGCLLTQNMEAVTPAGKGGS